MPVPFLQACQFVSAAAGAASLFRKSGSEASAQVEMLAALNMQLENVQQGILLLIDNLDEIRALVGEVPLMTVQQLAIDDLRRAREEYALWAERQADRLRSRGLEYAEANHEPAALSAASAAARSARMTIIDTAGPGRPSYSVALLISMAAYVELSSYSTMLSYTTADNLEESLRFRKQTIESYLTWFDLVLSDISESSLEKEIERVRGQRIDVAFLDRSNQISTALVTTSISDTNPNANYQYMNYPCGNNGGDPPTFYESRWVQSIMMQTSVTKGGFDSILSRPRGNELLSAFFELQDDGLLNMEDAPFDINESYDLIGPENLSFICTSGPKRGQMPYGGPIEIAQQQLWDGRNDRWALANRSRQWAVDQTSLSVDLGVRLISLASIKKTCLRARDWLRSMQAQADDYAREADLQLN